MGVGEVLDVFLNTSCHSAGSLTNRHRASTDYDLEQPPPLAGNNLEEQLRRFETYEIPLRFPFECPQNI